MTRLKYNAKLVDLGEEVEEEQSEKGFSDSEDLEIDMNDCEPPFLKG